MKTREINGVTYGVINSKEASNINREDLKNCNLIVEGNLIIKGALNAESVECENLTVHGASVIKGRLIPKQDKVTFKKCCNIHCSEPVEFTDGVYCKFHGGLRK
jgi:hypothetical protein